MRNEGRILLASLVWGTFVPIAVADEWKLTGSLDQKIEYDDNINLNVDPSAVSGYLMNPTLGVEWNTAVMKAGVTGRGDIRRYDDKQWNCDTFSLSANQQYLQKTSAFSVAGNYSRSCSYSDQLSDTGVIEPDNESETYSLSPSWSWQWSALDRFSISPSYSQTVYSSTGTSNGTETTNSNLQGNTTYSLNLSESHSWTRRLNSNASLSFSRSEFGDSINSSSQSSFGFQLGNTYNITRMWTVSIGGGLNWVQSPTNSNTINSSSSDSLFRTEIINFALNYNDRFVSYGVNYSRTNSPSASGQITEFNTFNMNYSYEMSREWSFNIDSSISNTQSIGQEQFQTSSNRTNYTATIGVTWNFDKEWQLTSSYRYRQQELSNSGSAQISNGQDGVLASNALMINLNYNWDGLRVFR